LAYDPQVGLVTSNTYGAASSSQSRTVGALTAHHSPRVVVPLLHVVQTTKRNLELYEVPYSEHSNYYELREFVEFLRPTCIVPTVLLTHLPSHPAVVSAYARFWHSPMIVDKF
jgi:hypothetical protein